MPHAHLNQPHLLDLIYDAGWVAKFVLILLLFSSVMCWTIIFAKWRKLQVALRQNEKFNSIFWSGKNIDEIMSKTTKFSDSPIAVIFKNGVKELQKLSTSPEDPTTHSEKIENIYRTLLRSASSEISILEKNIHWLATTASAAPFVGLFGTVWGIMNSFQSIGATGAANLTVVAPGISEALITTATGIGTAIPAVIAYNYFVGKIKNIAIDMECFSQDFINIIQRSFLNDRKRD
jgi:biopolymer transport protein TolQ